MADEAQENKTEPASGFRRDEARKKGKVAKSADVGSAAVLMASLLILWTAGPRIADGLFTVYRETLGGLCRPDLDAASASNMLIRTLFQGASAFLPVLGGMFVVAAMAGFAQVGFHPSTEIMMPKLDRFDPVGGSKKLMSMRSVVMLGVSLLKVSAVLLIGYLTVRSHLPEFMALNRASSTMIVTTIFRAALDVGLRTALLLLVIALIDYAYQKWQYEKDLRMSKQEVKDEQKMTDGNPEVTARIRRVQMTMARARMMNDVKKADVIVRNPTHFAVALKYDPEKASAPMVLAKGAGHLALRILEEARKHNIPTVFDPPVARALFKSVDVGGVIPPKLYRAVARLLVHIFRLRGKRPPTVR